MLRLLAVAALVAAPSAHARPAWADARVGTSPLNRPPHKVYEGVERKTVFVSQFSQEIYVQKSEYNWAKAKTECNGKVIEEAEFDFTPDNINLLKTHPSLVHTTGGGVRQYYSAGMDIKLDKLELLEGASQLTFLETEQYYGGPLGNETFEVRFNFTPRSHGKVLVRLTLTVRNLLQSRQGHNILKWRPLGWLWEGPSGAFLANTTFDFYLPWGTSQRSRSKARNHLPLHKGYPILANLRDPPPDESWSDRQLVMHFDFSFWISEWDHRGDPNTPGLQPLSLELLFEELAVGCNEYPYWVYLVAVSAAATFVFFATSVVGYLLLEGTCRGEEDPFARRKRLLYKVMSERLHEEEIEQKQKKLLQGK